MGSSSEVKAESEKARIARAAGLVSAMTLVSRVLGLVREVVFAALIGAGYHSDAFRIGFRIPNLLRDLFAEGALSAAFVPTYARTQKEGGHEAAFALANRVLTLLAVLLGGLIVAAIVFAWPLVSALAPGLRRRAREGRPDRLPDARHDAVPAPRLLRRRGDGDAQRRGAFRHPGPLAGALQPRGDPLGGAPLGAWGSPSSRS